MLSGWSHRGRWDGRTCSTLGERRSACMTMRAVPIVMSVQIWRPLTWAAWSWRRRQYDLSKRRELLVKEHTVTSQNTGIFRNRTSRKRALLEASVFPPFCLHFVLVLWEGRAGGIWETSKQSDDPSPASPEVTVCVASRLHYPDAYSTVCFVSPCLSLVRYLGGDYLETFMALKFPLFP